MTQKLDKEHVDAILDLRTKFAQNANTLGSIAIEEYAMNLQITQLETARQTLLTEFQELRETETTLMGDLKNRYGEGQINIEDGTFTSED
jgi:hypothetical protein